MDQKRQDDVEKPSRLLQLPREIRDLIYEYTLCPGVVPIEYTVAEVQMPAHTSTTAPEYLEFLAKYRVHHPPKSTLKQRRTWSTPGILLDMPRGYSIPTMTWPREFHLTYQLASSDQSNLSSTIDLALLKTCKQVYMEASKIFYNKNTFSFMDDNSISTAFAFLCDRPATSLPNIRSLELGLIERRSRIQSENFKRAGFLPPTTRKVIDGTYLRDGYEYFRNLCSLISNPKMNLHSLYLAVRTSNGSEASSHPHSVDEALLLDHPKFWPPRPWIAYWIDPLLDLTGLSVLNVCWSFDIPRFQKMVDTVSFFQQHILSRQRARQSERENDEAQKSFRFRALHTSALGQKNSIHIKSIFSRRRPHWETYTLAVNNLEKVPDSDQLLEYHETITRQREFHNKRSYRHGLYIFDCEIRSI